MTKRAVYQINPENLEIIKEWESVSDAAESMKFPQPAICAAAAGHRISANGFYWCFVDSYTESWKPKKRKTKAVMCVENMVMYNSIKEAAESTGYKESSIRKCCADPTGKTSNRGLHWRYINDGE